LIIIEDVRSGNTFVIQCSDWFAHPKGKWEDYWDATTDMPIGTANGANVQEAMANLMIDTQERSENLPVRGTTAMIKAARKADVVSGLINAAAHYRNKKNIVAWDWNDDLTRLDKMVGRWGLKPEQYNGKKRYVKRIRD